MRSVILGALLLPSVLSAQQSRKFTPDDMLNVVSYSPLDLSPDGRWLAANVSKNRDRLGTNYHRTSDPTHINPSKSELVLIDTKTGETTKPLQGKGTVRSAQWSPDGTRMLLVMLPPGAEVPVAMIWTRGSSALTPIPVPKTHYVSEQGEFRWMPDGKEVVLSLRSFEWRTKASAMFKKLVDGPIVEMSSSHPFLGWEELSRQGMLRSVVAVDVAKGTTRELIPESRISGALSIFGGTGSISDDGTRLSYTKDTLTKTAYAKLSIPGKREVQVIVPASDPRYAGAERQARLEREKEIGLAWSKDGKRYAYAKEGRVFVGTLDASTPDSAGKLKPAEKQLAGPPPDTSKAKPATPAGPVPDSVRDRKAKESFSLVRLDPEGGWVLASNSEGFWEIDAGSGNKQLVARSDTSSSAPQYSFAAMSPRGDALFFTSSMRTQWERGIHRYDRGARQLRPLVKDAHRYGGLQLSKDGSTLVFTKAEGSRPTDLYSMAAEGGTPKRLTQANPSLDEPQMSRTELISYLDADGRRQFGVVYYPTDFERGKKYPTVLHLYEQFFDEEFEQADKMLNTNGYVVVRPSVPTKADPGFVNESWAKGATAAANKLIEMGIADSARLGVYGCSYGGFATSLIVTQTTRFKAGIAIAPPTDMIVGSSRVDLQACKLEYSIVSPK